MSEKQNVKVYNHPCGDLFIHVPHTVREVEGPDGITKRYVCPGYLLWPLS